MNIQQLRQSLRVQWLDYYREHRDWLIRIGVWVTCEGKRRPSSSFILATLSVLEPKLTQLLPLVVDLSSNPDRIVIALGLNFNPDEELEAFEQEKQTATNGQIRRMLPSRSSEIVEVPVKRAVESPRTIAVEPVKTPPKPAQSVPPLHNAQSVPPLHKPTHPSHTESIASPFGNPPDLLVESAEETPEAKTEVEEVEISRPPVQTVSNSASEASARPVMDTVELAAGELPKREVSATDETCEGVRARSAIRNRKDSR